uniref:Uncharacterized protein n=1 Tax=Arundo donax TaxID=35708 RepID=A0A0A9HDW6_ARUDO
MMITFPLGSLQQIAYLHRLKMFTQSSSLQSCSTNCNQQSQICINRKKNKETSDNFKI